MLTFLAPTALFGLLLLSIPVAVHLFKPRKMRQTPFSSLRWLRVTKQRLSRRVQWHQLLLFLLRAAFILLLVFALARPLVTATNQGRFVDRYVVLDVSRSMNYTVPGRPTPLEQARQFAGEVVEHARAADRTAILLTGSRTQVLTPPSFNARTSLPLLHAVRPTLTDTNLTSALPVVRSMLDQTRPDTDVELYFLTDNHQQAWNQGEIAAFLKDLRVSVRVQVVDVGIAGAQNGWIARARLLDSGEGSKRLLRVDVGCVGDRVQERTVRVTGLGSLPERSHAVTLEPGQPTVVEFEVPAGLDLRGQVARVSLEPPDALPDDDLYFLSLDGTASQRVLLVDVETGPNESDRTGLYLRAALESLAPNAGSAPNLTTRTPANLTPRDVANADLVLLAGVPELRDSVVETLEDRVKAGGSLVLFLGDTIKQNFYNEKLHKALQPAEGLLPCALKARETTAQESGVALTNVRWSHRLLALHNDPMLGDLAQARFRTYYRFATPPAETDTVLAWIGDVPAIVEHPAGAGKVILFNTSATDDWSTLPRGKSLPPLVDQLLTYLGGGARRGFETGDAVVLPLSGWQSGETVAVRTPRGATLTPCITSANGRPLLQVAEVAEAGVYRVERPSSPGADFAFVVNVGRGDSVPTPTDAGTLTTWWQPASAEVLNPEAARDRLGRADASVSVWPWLVAFAALMLLLETFFVHRLCPQMNPNLADVVVHRRGLLRPLNEQAK